LTVNISMGIARTTPVIISQKTNKNYREPSAKEEGPRTKIWDFAGSRSDSSKNCANGHKSNKILPHSEEQAGTQKY